jgi:hypothetical protein
MDDAGALLDGGHRPVQPNRRGPSGQDRLPSLPSAQPDPKLLVPKLPDPKLLVPKLLIPELCVRELWVLQVTYQFPRNRIPKLLYVFIYWFPNMRFSKHSYLFPTY